MRWNHVTRGQSWVSLLRGSWFVLVVGVCAACGLGACAQNIPSKYARQAEPGATLTTLTSRPEAYQGKVVILGGVIIEEKQEGERVWLRMRNRPLDEDYMPHRPDSLSDTEAGYYWVTVASSGLPKSYRNWARVTVVGRVAGGPGTEGRPSAGTEPVLSALYLRGWGLSSTHDSVWEESQDPNYVVSTPAGVGGEFGR